ncbi:MAG: hypothetical protein KF886_00690 [Candidatus Hydrogenedentes bacterium]|nr:hypothetical protein [Candidatus Hydrogenedentota bacterium]
MKTFLFVGAIVVLFLTSNTTAVAGTFVPPRFTVTAEISETALIAGAPLYVYLTVTREEDGNPELATVSLTSINDNVRLQIDDLNAQEVKRRPRQPWPAVNGLEFLLFKPLGAGESYTKTLIVHRWSSTALPAGSYTVVVEAPRLNYYMEKNRSEWHPVLEKPFRKAIPLKILPPDHERVARIFDEMLTAVTAESTPWSDRYRALDSIIFAQGPDALASQLGLLAAMEKDTVRFGYGQKEIVTMLWYIVQSADVATARALAALARGPVFGTNLDGEDHSGRGIWPMLGWAIHELHRTGSPEVQAVTKELVEVVPDKPGLVEMTFQHGGMQFDKDY